MGMAPVHSFICSVVSLLELLVSVHFLAGPLNDRIELADRPTTDVQSGQVKNCSRGPCTDRWALQSSRGVTPSRGVCAEVKDLLSLLTHPSTKIRNNLLVAQALGD